MFNMDRILRALRAPGSQSDIEGVAPTQHVYAKSEGSSRCDLEKHPLALTPDALPVNVTGYVVKSKTRVLDRWLDRVVQFSGSPYVFLGITGALLVWIFLAIPFHGHIKWQVVISDVQAIVSYVFDSFLMRQLLNEHDHCIQAVAEIRSRNLSHERMLKSLVEDAEKQAAVLSAVAASSESEEGSEGDTGTGPFEADLPADNWFGRLSTALAHFLGHIATVSVYWVGVFIWLGFGHYCGWSDMWELYMNSATSALMIFVFSFLANINERHDQYTRRSLDVIYQADSTLEQKLRLLSGDTLDNQPVIIPAPKVNPLQRAIYYYADIVGTLVGVGLLLLVTVIWILLGPVMSFNSNWWLLIGTYAGLVGMNDGFVLRNVQSRLRSHEDHQFLAVDSEDAGLFGTIGVCPPKKGVVQSHTLTHRISCAMGRTCAHEAMVLAGFLTIVGLVIGSSILKWTVTGQLLCNVPPSIIESFFMVILITGHNLGDAQKRVDLQNIYHRRLRLLQFVQRLEANLEFSSASEEEVVSPVQVVEVVVDEAQ